MKNKLIVTFFLLILCAGSVTTALKSFDTIEITAGSSFSVISPVADITDDKDDRSSLFRNIHVTGDYNLYTPGQYTLQYVATDSDGHTSLPETLTLIVK